MTHHSLALLVLLAACAAEPAPLPDPPQAQPPTQPQPRRVAKLPVPPQPPEPAAPSMEASDTTAAVNILSPSQVLASAAQARTAANGYVGWKDGKEDNIDRLTVLVKALDAAVAQMRAGEIKGRYQAPDVVAARGALRDLRSFLSNKGD